jgi:RNA polymerase sigma-70 factor (ECF subfamily)
MLKQNVQKLSGPVQVARDVLSRRATQAVLATLIRLLGDFDAAEAALHDAFAVVVEQWLVSTG